MEESEFTITTEAFAGPISLLLELVQKRKVFINDIALADVADEFIHIIRSRQRVGGLTEEASFVQVAATLLLLKSKSLLPHFTVTTEEEESALELARRLEIFEHIRSRASQLGGVYGKQIYLAKPVRTHFEEPNFTPDERLMMKEHLLTVLKRVRENLPQKHMPERVSVKQTVRLEDVLGDLTKRIKKCVAVSFREFARIGKSSKSDVVVHFMALLELVKQGFLEAEQRERNGDIELTYKEVTVPNYS